MFYYPTMSDFTERAQPNTAPVHFEMNWWTCSLHLVLSLMNFLEALQSYSLIFAWFLKIDTSTDRLYFGGAVPLSTTVFSSVLALNMDNWVATSVKHQVGL
ncbi:hypothetical protein CBL_01123 [Carabus blaptoides fortunei]